MSDEAQDEKPRQLTRRQRKFISLYMSGFSGADAIRQCGYKGKHAKQVAYLMLQHNLVKAEIAERRANEDASLIIHREVVERRLAAIITGTVAELHDAQGDLIPVRALTADAAASIGGIEVEMVDSGRRTPAGADESKAAAEAEVLIGRSTVRKVKMLDPIRAAEVLARIKGWNKDRVDLNVNAPAPIITIVPYDDTDDPVPG